MKKEDSSITRRILAELLNPDTANGKYEASPVKNLSKADRVQTSPTKKNDREVKLRRIINFGSGFYSIAEARAVTRIGESFIRQWISEGRLTLLTYPGGKREYISGIELTEVVLQHNLEKLNGKV